MKNRKSWARSLSFILWCTFMWQIKSSISKTSLRMMQLNSKLCLGQYPRKTRSLFFEIAKLSLLVSIIWKNWGDCLFTELFSALYNVKNFAWQNYRKRIYAHGSFISSVTMQTIIKNSEVDIKINFTFSCEADAFTKRLVVLIISVISVQGPSSQDSL